MDGRGGYEQSSSHTPTSNPGTRNPGTRIGQPTNISSGVEGDPSNSGKVGSGFSGRAWGGNGGARPGQDARGPSLSKVRDKSQITCFKCNEKGHYKSEYPKSTVRITRISSPKPTKN